MSATGAHRPGGGASQGTQVRVRQRHGATPNGIWGMALFLCAEVALFGTLIGSYYYLDFIAKAWPPRGIKPPEVILPLVATAVLVSTVAPIRLAAVAARAGHRRSVVQWIGLALAIQGLYLAFQILLFIHDWHQFRPQGSAYGSIYYTLLVTHHAHVLGGMLLDVVLMAMVTTRGLTDYWLLAIRGLVLYWYVVAALAIVVVLVQLSPSL